MTASPTEFRRAVDALEGQFLKDFPNGDGSRLLGSQSFGRGFCQGLLMDYDEERKHWIQSAAFIEQIADLVRRRRIFLTRGTVTLGRTGANVTTTWAKMFPGTELKHLNAAERTLENSGRLIRMFEGEKYVYNAVEVTPKNTFFTSLWSFLPTRSRASHRRWLTRQVTSLLDKTQKPGHGLLVSNVWLRARSTPGGCHSLYHFEQLDEFILQARHPA